MAALTESGEHLLGLVNDVLDYARLGAGRVELNRGPLAPEDMLRQVCELLSPKAHEKGVEIGWAADPGLPSVMADEGRLRQILLNLAGNAVKFVERGGVLVLAEQTDAGALRFTVSDTGPGVPEAERRRGSSMRSLEGGQRPRRAPGWRRPRPRHRRPARGGDGRAAGRRRRPGRPARISWFEATFDLASAPAPATASLDGRIVAIVSPSAIVREAAARQIEASGGRAVRAERRSGADADRRRRRGAGRSTCWPKANCSNRRLAAPRLSLLRPEERERDRALSRKAGFGGYLIKLAAAASLVERVLLAGKTQAPHDDDRIAPRRPPDAPTAGGVRVLLAEDNPINAMLARTLLRREGAVIQHVENGGAALEALMTGAYDLILMDVRMPGLGGLDATRALRARGVDTPVVALTANAFEDDRRACLAAGMDDFLVKPLSPAARRSALARWTGPGWTRKPRRAKVAS